MSRRSSSLTHIRRLRAGESTGDASRLPAQTLTDLPEPPRRLAKPTAPDDVDDALDDLARELALHIAVVRCQREKRGGIMNTTLAASVTVDLPTGWIEPLARGGAMNIGGREWTASMLAVHADQPIATWRALREAARAWRLARLDLAPIGFPLAVLPALEAQLPAVAARLLGCLLLDQSGNDLNLLLERSGHGGFPDLGAWANCLGEERTERRGADLQATFGLESAAVRLGVFDPPTQEERSVPAKAWEPSLCRTQAAALLGEPIESLMKIPGVTIARPSERLTDVVLSSEQMRLVRGLDAAWGDKPGATNALAILLHGPSGTGKTLLARAFAGEHGIPLILLNGAHRGGRHDDEGEDLAGQIAGLVRRAAAERAILFIDEADDLLREGTDASRAFLLALERHPAVVVLATNKPLVFDPALDRRLQVKIRMDIPGPSERVAILALELARSGVPLDPGLVEDERLQRMAEGARLSGGHWRSVVQVAGMLAGTRGATAGTPVALTDLAEALRLQVADEQVVDQSRATRVRWVERPRPADAIIWGEARMSRFTALATAIGTLRRQRSTTVHAGIGAVVAVHGPDRALASELAEALATTLHLPVARIGDWQLPRNRAADEETASAPRSRDLFQEISAWEGAASRPPSAAGGRPSDQEPTSVWNERDIAALLRDLGGCSVVHLELAAAADTQGLLPLLDLLTASPHLTLVHVCDHAVPPDVRRRAAATVPWAVVDPAMRRLRWAALGASGEPPVVTAVAELMAAATRQALMMAGFTGEDTAGALP